MRDVIVEYWPFWYPVVLIGAPCVVAFARKRGRARTDRARRSLDEQAARRATRPLPAPIDVEPMR